MTELKLRLGLEQTRSDVLQAEREQATTGRAGACRELEGMPVRS